MAKKTGKTGRGKGRGPGAEGKRKKKKAGKKRGGARGGHAEGAAVFKELVRLYPDAECALRHKNAFELLIATILSAQTTDVRVNMVTPALFKKYPTPKAMAAAEQEDLEELVRTTGFFRNKAKSIKGAATAIVERHDGKVPDTMERLTDLPGVARKTANVVLGNAFDKNEGFVVDTHVGRLSQRLGLSKQKDPVKIEQDLVKVFEREHWALLAHLLIYHGRQVCDARKPKCSECTLAKLCPQVGVTTQA